MHRSRNHAGKTCRGCGNYPSYVNRLIKKNENIVNKTFVQMLESLGYDIDFKNDFYADHLKTYDLDDGVKHNYAIFQDVLAKIK
jgi:hypothetical protein